MERVEWIEVWMDTAAGGINLYVLRYLNTGKFELLDPHRNSAVVETFDSYEDAELWLGDEEYSIVEGREHYSAGVFTRPPDSPPRQS